MAWRDELRPASFRGVPFFISKADTEHRILADEQVFPGRTLAEESARVADLGTGPRRFTLDAYVVGADYLDRRNALEKALTEGGSGRLVHPYRGERTVSIVGTVRTSESPRRGGLATIRFTCADVSEAGLASQIDTGAIADRDLDAYLETLTEDFNERYQAKEVSQTFRQASQDSFSSAVDGLRSAHQQISQRIGVIDDFSTTVRSFESALSSFAALPGEGATALLGAMRAVTQLPQNAENALTNSLGTVRTVADELLDAMSGLMRFGQDDRPIPITTPSGIAEFQLRATVNDFVRGGAIAQTARVLLTLEFDSRTRATSIRDAIGDEMDRSADDGVAGGTSSSGAKLYQDLVRARVSLYRRLGEIALSLPEIQSYRLPDAQPLLVVAHHLWGDATRESEILDRNIVRDPSLVGIGTALEVPRE
jgi:prophage DNA circulation protein